MSWKLKKMTATFGQQNQATLSLGNLLSTPVILMLWRRLAIFMRSGVWFARCHTTLQLNDDMIVVFRSLFRARLRLPIFMMISKVLKKYEIYMHQLTPNAIVRLSIYIWTVRSQGVSASAEAFCRIHEPHYQTKVRPSDGLNYNFGCYNFAYQKV